MGGQLRTVEQKIAFLAGRAHGIVTRRELLDAEISAREVDRRIANGVLAAEYRGVYRVGPRTTEAGYMAAVKACGDGAALSGFAAAQHMGLVRRPPSLPEVTAPGEREIPGVVTRRSQRIERWIFNGIPTTTVARTLVDIAGRLDDEELTRVVHDAQVRYGTTPRQVEALLRRRPKSKGAARLRRAIRGDMRVSLSALERKFLALLREAGLPLPDHTNHKTGGYYVDCRWTRQKLTVELDSYRFHNTRHAFEQDRKRERQAYARGDQFRRYTWGDVFEDAAPMLSELRALL